MTFFSLILPCYNVEKYVERCVQSILAQDFADCEIVLVDDGSKDSTPEICDRLAAQDRRIHVIHQENGGLSSARNVGLSVAAGEYVWFVDSDDWIEPGALTILHRACLETAPEIVKFGYFRAAGEKKCAPALVSPGLYDGVRLAELRRDACVKPSWYGLSAWSHVYRRSVLERHRLIFVSERVVCSEDYLFNLTALEKVQRLQVLDMQLYTYELRPGSLTQSYKPDLPRRYAELHRKLRESGVCGALADRFYVWHLVASTCIPHEYRNINETHTMAMARTNVRQLLQDKALRSAVLKSDKRGISFRKIIQMVALYQGYEPLFYYLHVVKPARRHGAQA